MRRLHKFWLTSLSLLLSLVLAAQSGASALDRAAVELREGRFREVLALIGGEPEDNLRYRYLAGLALEGVDSLAAARAQWLAYIELAEEETVDSDYHRGLGHFCLANNFLLSGEKGEAERCLRVSLDPSITLPDTLAAKVWNSYGVLRIEQNDERGARSAFERSVGLWSSAGRPERALLPRLYLVRLRQWEDPVGAVRELEELLCLPKLPLDDLHPATLELELSKIHLRGGDLTAARRAFERAVEKVECCEEGRPFSEREYFQSVKGLLHLREGRPDLAVVAFTEVDTAGGAASILPPGERLYYSGLSRQYRGRHRAAIALYKEAIEQIGDENDELRATIYRHIGECHLGQNSFALALEFLRTAEDIQREGGKAAEPQLALLTAEALLGNRDTVAAGRILEGVRSACTSLGRGQGDVEVCLGLSEVHQQAGDTTAAAEVLTRLKDYRGDLSPLHRARLFGGIAFLHWDAERKEAAGDYSQQSIEALLEHWSSLRGMDGFRLQRNYFDRIFRLGISCALAADDADRALRIAEVARGLDLKGELLTNLPERNLGQTGTREYLGRVTARLSSGQSVVYYLRGIAEVHAVVISHAGETLIVRIGAAETVDQQVNSYLDYLADSVTGLNLDITVANDIYARVCSLSHELYLRLVEPLELPEEEELLIVPAGNLHFLSFASLLRRMPEAPALFQAHDYLVRYHAVAYLPTLGVLDREQKPNAATSHSLTGFAPGYGPGSELSALLNNQQEVARLEDQFSGAFHYGAAATRDKLPGMAAASDQLLHLSMHAVFNPLLPDSSWLAFAGAETVGERAWYFGHEIEEQFGAYPFVFLSACQTANGEFYRGEGALSLTRSLMARGNEHVVSSLWNVDDGEVGSLVHAFYESLFEEGNSVRSLRSAQLAYLDQANPKFAYPYYWAGFFHYGTAAAVTPQRKFNYWCLAILVALAAASLVLWHRNR